MVVFDGGLTVPRSRALGIPLKIEQPTHVHASFKTLMEGAQVRAVLMAAAEVQAFQEGLPHSMVAATAYGAEGEFRSLVMRPGDYFVLIDNRRDDNPSQAVHARVTTAEDPSLPYKLPPVRRRAVVAISLVLFAAVAGWSGWRLRGVTLFR
jgi:hypothetical protein